ncbi:hypothetical protein GQ600_11168 [Phytophthora cactorum]|nr:hypothetical protein GQ600_11168 [Phytophthora cactorum]
MRSRWVDSLKRGISASRGRTSARHSPRGHIRTHTELNAVFRVRAEPRSVARVLENCVLQGGVHHTHMHVLTYLGRPLRSECCCYPVAVQWFRAVGEQDDFQDIGKVMIEDEDVLKTKMLEYGPIKEDPEVRSKEIVLFMGLRSISVQDGSEYMNEEELRVRRCVEGKTESWTLLIDDRRVRLTCESSLIPPFESLYTPDIKLEMVRGTPNEFYLHLAQGCYVRLRAESNTVRDIIVLTLRAFCKMAVSDETTHDAVARGLSPMLTLRKIAQDEESKKQPQLYTPSLDFDQQTQEAPPPPPRQCQCTIYPGTDRRVTRSVWTRRSPLHKTVVEELDESLGSGSRRPSIASSIGGGMGGDGWLNSEGLDDSLLMDAEALIGNAQKMGIQYQILPRAPKRISILDIPDLQIIEAMEVLNDQALPEEEKMRWQQRDQRRRRGSNSTQAIQTLRVTRNMATMSTEVLLLGCQARGDTIQAARREAELNSSFRKDIESLRSALTSMQLADKVYDLVSTDLQQLVKRTAAEPAPPVPNVSY